jgi:antitoxin CcdA
MNRPAKIDGAKRATNISLSESLVDEAKALGINLSQACEEGLSQRVAETKAERWKRENRDAIDSWNAWTGKHGLPLTKYRQF